LKYRVLSYKNTLFTLFHYRFFSIPLKEAISQQPYLTKKENGETSADDRGRASFSNHRPCDALWRRGGMVTQAESFQYSWNSLLKK
jgi:hypothetical protein